MNPDDAATSDPTVPQASRPIGIARSFRRAQLNFNLIPGAISASPLVFMWLEKSVPGFGILALVAMIPALVASIFFLPALMLLKTYTHYDPSTLKGGSLLPLPASSVTEWAMLLAVHTALISMLWGIWRYTRRPERRKA